MNKIAKMNFREKSLFFAKMSGYAYYDLKNFKSKIKPEGIQIKTAFDDGGAQAFSLFTDHDLIITCRGTEPTCLSDLKADLRAWPKQSKSGGRVHSGFDWHVSKIWPEIVADLEFAQNNDLDIWFTGHSLGAAMATILASKCRYDQKLPDPLQVFTYGSPRVGWKKYVDSLSINHVRWVNNNDIVAYVPPAFFGYKHHGKEYYMNTWGNVRSPSGWQKLKDKFRGILLGWKNGSIDSFADHSITRYIENLETYNKNMEFLQGSIISKK